MERITYKSRWPELLGEEHTIPESYDTKSRPEAFYNELRKILGIEISDQELEEKIQQMSEESRQQNIMRHLKPESVRLYDLITNIELIMLVYQESGEPISRQRAIQASLDMQNELLPKMMDDKYDRLGYFWGIGLLTAYYPTKDELGAILKIDLSQYPILSA